MWLDNAKTQLQARMILGIICYHINWFLSLLLGSCLFPRISLLLFCQLDVLDSVIRGRVETFLLCHYSVLGTCPTSLLKSDIFHELSLISR